MNILLIAGHGAGDPGAVSNIGGVSYQEQAETRALAAKVAALLRNYASVTVYDTARNAYADYRNGTLKAKANFSAYQYVLELHFNAASADSGDGRVKGAEAYVTDSEKGVAVEQAILKRLAALGFSNRGVKRKNWAVISAAKSSGVSACLLETCFLDDGDDMRLYAGNRDKAAQAIASGIVEGFGLTGKPTNAAGTVSDAACRAAIAKLAAAGVIATPAYWTAHYKELRYLDQLLINMAAKL